MVHIILLNLIYIDIILIIQSYYTISIPECIDNIT